MTVIRVLWMVSQRVTPLVSMEANKTHCLMGYRVRFKPSWWSYQEHTLYEVLGTKDQSFDKYFLCGKYFQKKI